MDPSPPARSRAAARLVYLVGPLLAGVGLVALVVYLTGPQAILAALSGLTRAQAAGLVLVAFAVSGFSALAWQVILGRYGHRVSTWLLFRLSVMAFGVGWLLPSGFVAGVPVAAYFLDRRGVPFARGLASFLIGRFFEIAGYALILPAILVADGRASVGVRAGGFAPVVLVAVAALDLVCGWRLGRRALGLVADWLPGVAQPALARGIEFCGVVAIFFEAPPARILAAAALSVLSIGVSFLRAVLTADFLQVGFSVPQVAVVFAFTLVLLSLPVLPGAMGVYEGGMVGVFHLMGRSVAQGVAYAMAVHAVELVVVLAGFIFLAELGAGLARGAGGGSGSGPGGTLGGGDLTRADARQ